MALVPSPGVIAPGSTFNNVAPGGVQNLYTTNYIANSSDDRVLDEIPYAYGAAYEPEKACLPGTREAIINAVIAWANDPTGPAVLLLTGFAGSGKSSIAHFIARYFDQEHRLGSSVFFDRAHQATRRPNNLFSTIARDVLRIDPARKESLINIIRDNPGLRTTPSPIRQFNELLLAPAGCRDSCPPIIIVIDALDESGDREERSGILAIFHDKEKMIRASTQFRFLLTSRNEQDIAVALGQSQHIAMERLHDAHRASTNADILAMIWDRLPSSRILDAHWPNDTWRHMLVEKSEGIFQWAATACLFISGKGKFRNQRKQFDLVMSSGSQLYELYLTVLNGIFDATDEDDMQSFSRVMGAVLVAREPLTLDALEHLCFEEDADFVISPMGSLLTGTSGSVPITSIHTSFRDFLADSQFSGPFYVELAPANTRMALSVLRCMGRDLHFNMSTFTSSHRANEDSNSNYIAMHISYCCCFWIDHVEDDQLESLDIIHDGISQFLRIRLLYWLEVMSILKQMTAAYQAINRLTIWLRLTNDNNADLAADAARFIAVFGGAMAYSAPHIYISALPFTPVKSLIYACYIPSFYNTLRVEAQSQSDNWPATQFISTGHQGAVNSVTFSPDGRSIASGSFDHTVRVWDATTGIHVAGPFVGHKGSVSSVAFSPVDRRIASGSFDRTIRVWDSVTGELVVGPFHGHTDRVLTIAFSPDGHRIVSGSTDATIRVWDARTGTPVLGPFEGHIGWIKSVAFSPDGRFIASGSNDATIRLWDATTGHLVTAPSEGHTSIVSSIAFSPDGCFLASGSHDRTIRVWSATTGVLFAGPYIGPTSWINTVAFSPDSRCIVSGSQHGTIRLWDVKTGNPVAGPYEGHGSIKSAAFSPDGRYIATGSEDQTIQAWDVIRLAFPALRLSDGVKYTVSSIAFSPDGQHFATYSNGQGIRLWGATSGRPLAQHFSGHTRSITCIAFSPNSQIIASGSHDNTVRVWDASTASGPNVSHLFEGHTDSVRSIAFSPDGLCVVSASYDRTVRIWDVKTGFIVDGPYEIQADLVEVVAFSSDIQYIVCGCSDGTARVWEVKTGVCVAGPFGCSNWVTSVAFSPDGHCVVTGLYDGTVRVWNAKTGAPVAGPFKGHTREISSIAFSHDNQYVVSGSNDCNVRIWRMTTGGLAGTLAGHTHPITSVSFSPDGRSIASGSKDGTVRIWDLTAMTLNKDLISDTQVVSPDAFDEGSSIRDDGWMINPTGALLFWVPPWHRVGLWKPQNTLLLGIRQTKLDLTCFVHGENWQQCLATQP